MKYPNLNEEKKLWRRGCKIVVGLDEAGRGCEKPDAEILTNNGWKFYNDVNLNDKVLCYTDDGYMKWQKIEKIIEKDFKGNLIELKNRGVDIIVTPDHYFTVVRRIFKRDKKDNNRLKLVGYGTREERKSISELADNDFIPRGGKWKGNSDRFFRLPEIGEHKELVINMEIWLAFLGIFLAEGSVYYYKKKGMYRITISQYKDASIGKYEKIYKLLKMLPFRFNRLKDGFNCCNKQLYTYLIQFGKRYDKFIPKDIKNLSPDLLNILINWMMVGDGSCYVGKDRMRVCVYYTVSKKLRDDFEEVLLKAGWTYHTSVRPFKDRYIGKRIIKKENLVPCFEIRLRRNNKVQIKSLHENKRFYKGKVFCLQLSKYHNFYVRRSGTGYFTGNSLAGPVVAGAVVLLNLKRKACLAGRQAKSVKQKLKGVKDSKKLSAAKREKLYKIITGCNFIEWGIGIVSEKVIDKINILEATKLAMIKALKDLEKKSDFLILDGNFKIKSKTLQKSIIKADEKVFSCAAASIIAKVTRDKIMKNYHKKYPCYCFDKHKGYPTELHRKLLGKFGPCPIHRKTFAPVKNLSKTYQVGKIY